MPRKPATPRKNFSTAYAGKDDADVSLKMDPEETPHGPSEELLEQIAKDAVVEEEQENIPIPTNNEELIKAAEEMYDLKEEIDRREAEVKQFKDRYNQLRQNVIPEAMKNLGMLNSKGKGSFTFSRGKIHLEQKLYAACSKENQEVLFEFLRKEGDAELIREVVNPQTLAAYIRDRRAEGLLDPPGASVHEEVTAKLTKSR